MNRLDRRLTILRAKRDGAFDTNQYYFENALRTRIARRVRSRLRRMEPVILITPRWSQVHRFLDDVTADLQVGEPSVVSRMLSLAPLEGRTHHQAWSWLVQAITEFCKLTLDGPAWQAVSRHGFREVMTNLLERAESGQRRCLMIVGLEHIHIDALTDLIHVFDAHRERYVERRRFNLLLAGSVAAPNLEFAGADRVVLQDFTELEAIEVLVEHLGPLESHRLESVVELVGGVPAILDALGASGDAILGTIVQDRESVWRALGHLAIEIRGAYEIVAADGELMQRLEQIARDGPLPIADRDDRLVRSGLVEHSTRDHTVRVRAPVFADLAQLT